MKKTVFLLTLVFFGLNAFGQFYTPDESFGTNGTVYYQHPNGNGNAFTPQFGLYDDGYYYLCSSSKIAKMNYTGAYVQNFGSGGFFTPNLETTSIRGMKKQGGYLYIYGSYKDYNTSDLFVLKLNLDGTPDTTFGVNGAATIDLGLAEVVNSISISSDGRIFATGTRRNPSSSQSYLIYFKLNPNGSTDFNFDPTGYKTFPSEFAMSGSIAEYGGGYLICGSMYVASYNRWKMILLNIDNSGNPVATFGDNGVKITDVPTFSGFEQEPILRDGKLYVSYSYYSGNGLGGGFIGVVTIVNVESNQLLYNASPYYKNYLEVDESGFWISGSEYSSYYPYGPNSFNLRRLHLDGSADPTFLNNIFTYNDFSQPGNVGYKYSVANIIIREPSGKIFLVGQAGAVGVVYFGLAALRLAEGELALPDNEIENSSITVFPNPFENKINLESKTALREVAVYDVAGKKIMDAIQRQNDGFLLSLDLSDLAKGIYLVKIRTDFNTVSKAVIKR